MTADPTHAAIQHFSTFALPVKQRFDCFMDVLHQSLWQVTDWDNIPEDFNVRLRTASLDSLTVAANDISAHHSHRTKGDVDRSRDRNFHLFVSLSAPWAFTHNGRHERLEVADVVMFGEGEHETHAPEGFKGVIVKCPERWMQTWLPDATSITGRSLRRDSKWGRVLSPMLRQLTPESVVDMALPESVVADQLGSVLALMVDDAERQAMPEFMQKIRDCIRQRCGERRLTALAVASSLGIPVGDLHRVLIASETTFAAELWQARALCRQGNARLTV